MQEMRRLKRKIEEQNTQLYNPVGLNILWPQKVAFLFVSGYFLRSRTTLNIDKRCLQLEIEYYVSLYPINHAYFSETYFFLFFFLAVIPILCSNDIVAEDGT